MKCRLDTEQKGVKDWMALHHVRLVSLPGPDGWLICNEWKCKLTFKRNRGKKTKSEEVDSRSAF